MNVKQINQFYFLVLVFVLFASACKKDKPAIDGNTKQTPTDDRVALTNDSIFLYAKEIYLWNENLPSYDTFNPRQYVNGRSDLEKYGNNLFNIAQYSTNKYDVEYYNGQEFTKYSTIEDISALSDLLAKRHNEQSTVNPLGIGDDIGIYGVGAFGPSDTNYVVFVKAVYPGSPAAQAGLTRGSIITKIGNEKIGDNYDADEPYISQLEHNPVAIDIEGKYVDGKRFQVSLKRAQYQSSPIYKDTVFHIGSKDVGYLAYSQFSSESNSKAELDRVFQKFSAGGVEDLIVDLRYNGGGFVKTAEHLINLIIPSGTTGTMFTEEYNQTMQQGKAKILENQPVRDESGQIIGTGTMAGSYRTINTPFDKEGNLNGIKNVVFLVTYNTASASELVINALKGLSSISVKLVGTTTYGKPVGFFPIRLDGIYDLYLPSFTTKNGKGEGDYYQGMIPDIQMIDTLDQNIDEYSAFDFGDSRELYTIEALKALNVSFPKASGKMALSKSVKGGETTDNKVIKKIKDNGIWKGMIENRKPVTK